MYNSYPPVPALAHFFAGRRVHSCVTERNEVEWRGASVYPNDPAKNVTEIGAAAGGSGGGTQDRGAWGRGPERWIVCRRCHTHPLLLPCVLNSKLWQADALAESKEPQPAIP